MGRSHREPARVYRDTDRGRQLARGTVSCLSTHWKTLLVAFLLPDIFTPMTAAVARIIDEVEHLSHPERVELRRHIVERTPMSDDLTDEDFAALAADSFRALDEEEAQHA